MAAEKKLMVLMTLNSLIQASQVLPVAPGRTFNGYTVIQSLGDTEDSYVSQVRNREGQLFTMRSDIHFVEKYMFDVERELFSTVSAAGVLGTTLHDSFIVGADGSKGRRFTVTDPSGRTLEQAVRATGAFPEAAAIDIAIQVSVSTRGLQDSGYNHNKIDYRSVAFKTMTDTRSTTFVDLGSVSKIQSGDTGLSFLKLALSPQIVYDRYVGVDEPGTNRWWFVNSAVQSDASITDFLGSNIPWKPQTRAAMRNARILAAFSSGKPSNLDIMDSVRDLLSGVSIPLDPPSPGDDRESWFIWAMTATSEESHIFNYVSARRHLFGNALSDLILATRLLYRFIVHGDLDRTKLSIPLLRYMVGAQRVEKDFVMTRFPGTDKDWFPWAMAEQNDESAITGFLNRPEFSPLERIAIRNSRIFERIASGKSVQSSIYDSVSEIYRFIIKTREPTTDEKWFEYVMMYGDSDESLVGYLAPRSELFSHDGADSIIFATRALVSLDRAAHRGRTDMIDIVKMFFQLQGVSANAYSDLIKGAQDRVATVSMIESLPVSDLSRKILIFANRVHHQTEKPLFEILISLLRNERFAIMDDMYVEEAPSGNHEYTMIYLHGMGAIGADDWKNFIHKKVGNGFGPNVRLVIPQVKSTTRNPKREWFQFIEGREPWDSSIKVGSLGDRKSLDDATEDLLNLVDAEAELLGGDYSRIFVMGYSKGGQMALWLGLMGNRPFGGIINYLGCLPFFEIESVSPHGRTVPVAHYHDPKDTIIQFRFAQAGAEVARAAGAAGYPGIIVSEVSGKDHHALSTNVLAAVKNWFINRTKV